MGWYVPQIFRGNKAATTKYTPQGAANPERVTGAMEYNGAPTGRDMAYQDSVRMKYGSVNSI